MAEFEYTAEELEREEWKPVSDTDGAYEVSDLGRVRRAIPGHCTYVGRILRTPLESNGYPTVCLMVMTPEPHRRVLAVHRLVAAEFLGPRPAGFDTDHVDGAKTNNRLRNLEYVTERENSQRASMLGLLPTGDEHWTKRLPDRVARGERNGSRRHPERIAASARERARLRPETFPRGERVSTAKVTAEDVRSMRALYAAGVSIRILMQRFGLSKAQVHKIVNRQSWRHVT